MSAESTPRFTSRFMASKRYRWIAGAIVLVFTFFLLQKHRPLVQSTPPLHATADVDWSRFAYTQYVTDSEYLCNSVMFFEALHRLSSRADRVMMYPSSMLESGEDSKEARLLLKARDEFNVKLIPITIQHRNNADATWADSFTKLLAFNQTQYSRVLSIDSDSILLQDMDELFLLPSVPVAMPRAYWLFPDKAILSSQVMLVEPSEVEFTRIMEKINSASRYDYDMEIVNYLYHDNALVLPHRRYDILTGEFRGEDHSEYLGSDVEAWDPAAVYNEAKLVHFSDWPLPKPWLPTPEDLRLQLQPKCTNVTDGAGSCAARIIWNSFYTDFKKKRKEVCG
ncbi:nucleotide-diphospho-sugar transferase [Thelonectria olida]|uniref:Nucleotide-diphospho-sugar transferase n=1 Tax=Thelonectria olida TaxID=1576542 RepID=A0A9P8WEH6_9HYPO|nr:nucleotide-diphospho-sugar transferase [Thelonectria olida]